MKKVKSFPGWYNLLQAQSAASRKKLVAIALDNIRRGGDIHDEIVPECDEMVKALKRDFRFVGISPNLMYLKTEGSQDDLDATHVHTWGMCTLVYKHKTLPFLIQINAAMEWDDSMLAKIPANADLFAGISIRGGTS
jgi:hypothetical protein